MRRTKIAISCYYLIQLIIVVLIILTKSFLSIEIKPVEFSVTYMLGTLICAAFENKVFMTELKTYAPNIYKVLYEEKYVENGYVNGFRWLSYTFGQPCDEPYKDKVVKNCVKAMLISPLIMLVIIVVFNLYNYV